MFSVVYILGAAHSGSTLLDLILGSYPNVVSTGELWAFPYWIRENKKCSCDQSIRECPHWHQILKRLCHKVEWEPDKMHTSSELHEPTRLWKIQSIWRKGTSFSKEELRKYGAREYELFSAIAEETDVKYVIDSSKRLDRLERLFYSGLFDLKIIHLVRDGRYAVDATRRAAKRRAARTGERPRRRYLNSVWIYSGWIINMLGQLNFLNQLDQTMYIRVSYEELATNPRSTVESLCTFLGLDFDSDVLNPISPRYVFKQEHHIIGGSRLTKQVQMNPEMPITYRNSWEKNLSAVDRWVFTLLGGLSINKKLHIPKINKVNR